MKTLVMLDEQGGKVPYYVVLCCTTDLSVDVWVLDTNRVITSVSCVLDVYTLFCLCWVIHKYICYPKSFQNVRSKSLLDLSALYRHTTVYDNVNITSNAYFNYYVCFKLDFMVILQKCFSDIGVFFCVWQTNHGLFWKTLPLTSKIVSN
jgi:hypothetical protein